MSGERLNVFATRMTLTMMKNRAKGAKAGHKLLKRKADALTMKFRSMAKVIKDVGPPGTHHTLCAHGACGPCRACRPRLLCPFLCACCASRSSSVCPPTCVGVGGIPARVVLRVRRCAAACRYVRAV